MEGKRKEKKFYLFIENPHLKVDLLQKQDKTFRDLQAQQVWHTIPWNEFESNVAILNLLRNMGHILFSFLNKSPQATLVEKLVSGKLAKQQYIEQEAAVVRRKEEALDRIHQILKAF